MSASRSRLLSVIFLDNLHIVKESTNLYAARGTNSLINTPLIIKSKVLWKWFNYLTSYKKSVIAFVPNSLSSNSFLFLYSCN